MKRAILILPLLAFVLLLGFLYAGLHHDPHDIPSPLIGRPAPAFNLPRLFSPTQTVSPAQLHGKVWLLNVWASWCVSCREEHPLLVAWAHDRHVPLIGMDYKDDSTDARRLLAADGDPYGEVAIDADGHTGINWGVYGVPETYVIDAQGIIRRKITGPITPDILQNEILPLVAKLSK